MTTKEAPEHVIARWGGLKSRMRALPPDGNLSMILSGVTNPLDTIVGLDFDQTITGKVCKIKFRFRGKP